MTTPKPELPWYQFSLRSLLRFTVFVAVLCSIGVCSDWTVAAIIAVGDVSGRIVARSWVDLIIGILVGNVGAAAAVVASALLGVLIVDTPHVQAWWFVAAMIIGALIGGIVGGLCVRSRSRQ